MRIESVKSLYRPDINGIRVIEWRTEVNGNKHYYSSRTYTIRLYSKDGVLEEYSNKREVDVRV